MKQKLPYLLAIIIIIAGCRKNPAVSPPTIAGFDPQKLAPFNYITIYGSHFDSVATKNLVSFNGQPATVFKVQGDSVLMVVVPQNVTPGKITVTANGVTATSANSYTVLPGGWIRKVDFPDVSAPMGRTNGVGFAIDNTGYLGLGTDNGAALSDLYAYDPATDKWTTKSSMPLGVEEAFSMVINGKAYAGTGNTRNINGNSKQFFEYDPILDKWTPKSDFPGPQGRQGALGFGVGDKGYAGFGRYDGNIWFKDWWQYDPATDSWTRKADFPGTFPTSPGSGFALNNKIYVGPAVSSTSSTEWWQYDPADDTWTQKKNIPLIRYLILKGVVINNKGYLMGPENWQYDDVADSWTQKAIFIPRYGGALFSIGNKGYYGTGLGYPSVFLNHDFWEYTPE